MPNVTIHLATGRESMVGGESDPFYGEIEYAYDGHSAKSRSTSEQEILPLLYGVAGTGGARAVCCRQLPRLSADGGCKPTSVWFYVLAPMLIVTAWWWSGRPPIGKELEQDGDQS